MDRAELEGLDRESLVARAQAAGIRRARILTRPELIDELLRLDPTIDEASLRRSRGFFGRARDLLTRVVERGLHLPDAADRLRSALTSPLPEVPRPEPQAVPTVTLAEIYAAQGHKQRAIETLERVLEREPDHGAARTLLDRLKDAAYVAPEPPLPPEKEIEEQFPEPGAGFAAEVEEEPRVEAIASSPHAPECVAIPGSGRRAYVWWRIDEALLRGPFAVRVLVLEPTWDGPREEVRDLALDHAAGEAVVSDLPERAVVRVAAGYTSDGAFVPLAHSPALETRGHDGELVRWTVDGVVPVVLDDPRAEAIALAALGARRALGAS